MSSTSINNSELNRGFKEVKALIEGMNSSLGDQKPEADMPVYYRSRADEGSLSFWGEDITRYRQCVDTLHAVVRGNAEEQWSIKAVEKLVDDALFVSFDIREKSPQTFESRLHTALEALKHALLAPFVTREFFFTVLGLDLRNTSAKVGKVKFISGTDEDIHRLCARVNQMVDASASPANVRDEFKKDNQENFFKFFKGGSMACVIGSAGDLEAARNIALNELQMTLDIINFYVLSVHDAELNVRAYLPGDARSIQTLDVSFGEDKSFNLQYSKRGPSINFNFESLNGSRAVQLGLSRLSTILFKELRSDLEEKILNAAKIAGKATASTRHEDAFLLYAIALESILVGGSEKADTTYKLSTRCAHLLGNNLENKKHIKKQVAELYGIRSAIVHRGDNDFTNVDLTVIRRYVQSVLVKLLTAKDFENFTKKEELIKWFEEKVLS